MNKELPLSIQYRAVSKVGEQCPLSGKEIKLNGSDKPYLLAKCEPCAEASNCPLLQDSIRGI